ncbi:unnamed protein product [Ectocarpus sp. 6 AP-2014]
MKLLPSLISLLSLEPTVPEINLLLASVKKDIPGQQPTRRP